jgi:hypothetical protein
MEKLEHPQAKLGRQPQKDPGRFAVELALAIFGAAVVGLILPTTMWLLEGPPSLPGRYEFLWAFGTFLFGSILIAAPFAARFRTALEKKPRLRRALPWALAVLLANLLLCGLAILSPGGAFLAALIPLAFGGGFLAAWLQISQDERKRRRNQP